MKYFKLLLSIPSIFCLSLVACKGAKISLEEVEGRMIDYYKLDVVEDKFETVLVKIETKVTKNTGMFAKEEANYEQVLILKAQNGSSTMTKNLFSNYVFTFYYLTQLKQNVSTFSDSSINYYSYKKTGTIVECKGKSDNKVNGVSVSSKISDTVYVLDDGRLEKDEGSFSITYGGCWVNDRYYFNSELSYTMKVAYKWNKS